jgi:hypothetical protein
MEVTKMELENEKLLLKPNEVAKTPWGANINPLTP